MCGYEIDPLSRRGYCFQLAFMVGLPDRPTVTAWLLLTASVYGWSAAYPCRRTRHLLVAESRFVCQTVRRSAGFCFWFRIIRILTSTLIITNKIAMHFRQRLPSWLLKWHWLRFSIWYKKLRYREEHSESVFSTNLKLICDFLSYLAPFPSYDWLLVKFSLATEECLTLTPSLRVIPVSLKSRFFGLHFSRRKCPCIFKHVYV